jgi:cob(I)alamin adenosyltransferase
MKIYTRTGDNGTTGLYDGSRVQKSEQIIDVLGTLDELSAHIGMLLFHLKKSYITDAVDNLSFIPFLKNLQSTLLNIGSIIATPNPLPNQTLPSITDYNVQCVEKLIDAMDTRLKPLTVFILQHGKNEMEAWSHICRTITRRTERELNKYGNVDETILKFVNRLSDFFFTLARYVSE